MEEEEDWESYQRVFADGLEDGLGREDGFKLGCDMRTSRVYEL